MFFEVSRRPDVGSAFDSIAEILRAQYAVDFQLIAPSRKKQRIKIKCTRPGVKIVAPEDY